MRVLPRYYPPSLEDNEGGIAHLVMGVLPRYYPPCFDDFT
jgi:hypothetical protein